MENTCGAPGPPMPCKWLPYAQRWRKPFLGDDACSKLNQGPTKNNNNNNNNNNIKQPTTTNDQQQTLNSYKQQQPTTNKNNQQQPRINNQRSTPNTQQSTTNNQQLTFTNHSNQHQTSTITTAATTTTTTTTGSQEQIILKSLQSWCHSLTADTKCTFRMEESCGRKVESASKRSRTLQKCSGTCSSFSRWIQFDTMLKA